jgi:hypothetical protein
MRRRAALLALPAGLTVIVVAQVAAPLGSPPLYDGAVVQEPYRYLTPIQGPGGSPTSFHASPAVRDATSPQFVAATTESPPQAKLIAKPGAFVLPAGTTTVSIDPVAAAAPPSRSQRRQTAVRGAPPGRRSVPSKRRSKRQRRGGSR